NNIAAKVRNEWGAGFQVEDPDWFVIVLVTQNKEGKVLSVKFGEDNVGNSSQAKAFKNSVQRAVYKAIPLPITLDASVWDSNISFRFSPK
ncbi:MAG: TonB C-terminal domain-containing protein, partial [Candidatus Thioglobus sp.]|nr:TonB C-terminal domain-containing protein [Candidatus Thioglobus sp.]